MYYHFLLERIVLSYLNILIIKIINFKLIYLKIPKSMKPQFNRYLNEN